VRLPSWQAQLAGSKRWLLVPPPECYLQCQRFDVVVQQGDISEKLPEISPQMHITNVTTSRSCVGYEQMVPSDLCAAGSHQFDHWG